MPLVIPEKKKLPIRKIVGIVSLLIAVTMIFLGLRKPVPIAPPQTTSAKAAGIESFQSKVSQLAQPSEEGKPSAQVHLTTDEVRAAFSGVTPEQMAAASAAAGVSNEDLAAGEPIVSFEGDQMKGQFVSELGGKKLYITVNGRLGAKDGYATFEPTEFKIGDLTIPVSLVNDALQKKLLEEREHMKLPDFVSDLKVENGELVVTRK